jgi:hypothetical protein
VRLRVVGPAGMSVERAPLGLESAGPRLALPPGSTGENSVRFPST